MQRRDAIRTGISATSLATLWAAGLLPRTVLAAWPSDAFHAEELASAERLLVGDAVIEDSDLIDITAPDIAENGRVVPVDVAIELPEPRSLALLSDRNPFPLLAQARFTPRVAPRLGVRVKLGQSANLIALVESGGKLYRKTRAVKVTAGGCNG